MPQVSRWSDCSLELNEVNCKITPTELDLVDNNLCFILLIDAGDANDVDLRKLEAT